MLSVFGSADNFGWFLSGAVFWVFRGSRGVGGPRAVAVLFRWGFWGSAWGALHRLWAEPRVGPRGSRWGGVGMAWGFVGFFCGLLAARSGPGELSLVEWLDFRGEWAVGVCAGTDHERLSIGFVGVVYTGCPDEVHRPGACGLFRCFVSFYVCLGLMVWDVRALLVGGSFGKLPRLSSS